MIEQPRQVVIKAYPTAQKLIAQGNPSGLTVGAGLTRDGASWAVTKATVELGGTGLVRIVDFIQAFPTILTDEVKEAAKALDNVEFNRFLNTYLENDPDAIRAVDKVLKPVYDL